MPLTLPALIRHLPTAQPLARTWTFYASAQAADIIVDADPGWSLPSIVAWATAHMLLAAVTSRVLGAAAAGAGAAGDASSSGLRRLQLALAALVIGLLLGLVVTEQPTILLPVLGLALAYRGDTAPASREDRT